MKYAAIFFFLFSTLGFASGSIQFVSYEKPPASTTFSFPERKPFYPLSCSWSIVYNSEQEKKIVMGSLVLSSPDDLGRSSIYMEFNTFPFLSKIECFSQMTFALKTKAFFLIYDAFGKKVKTLHAIDLFSNDPGAVMKAMEMIGWNTKILSLWLKDENTGVVQYELPVEPVLDFLQVLRLKAKL